MPLTQQMINLIDVRDGLDNALIVSWIDAAYDNYAPLRARLDYYLSSSPAAIAAHAAGAKLLSIHRGEAHATLATQSNPGSVWVDPDNTEYSNPAEYSYFFADHGELKRFYAKRDFLHELSHAVLGTDDGIFARGVPTSLPSAATAQDLRGPNVDHENAIMSRLGDADYRVSYKGWVYPSDVGGMLSWTDGAGISTALVAEQARRGVGGAAAHQKQSAGTFPLRLAAEDWTSGDHVWLLDVMAEPCRTNSARLRRDVAADRKQTTSVLANFRQLAGAPDASVAERGFAATWASKGPSKHPVRIGPLAARLIDPDVLAKIKGAAGA